MEVNYIIVQAGGKGTRMKHLTYNKPKALVAINNLPILFHLFQKYPDKHYVIIGDYKYEVLEKYLETFAKVNYEMINAQGKQGTCAGLREAIKQIPSQEAFLLIWSDLILPEEYKMPENEGNYIGIAKDFPCRWKYENHVFQEIRSDQNGVAGLFLFKNNTFLLDVPEEGEFVRWLSQKSILFQELALYQTKEYGLLSEYDKLEQSRCRPFNKVLVEENQIVKEAVDEQGKRLAEYEVAWYKKIQEKNFSNIPKIYNFYPLRMEKIHGKNIYEYQLESTEKRKILYQLISCIRELHEMESCPADKDSYYEAYIGKTLERLKKVYTLVPFAKEETITINGVSCKNIFFQKEKVEEMVMAYLPERFVLLHGDCTFSNMLLKDGKTPIMIDPRGYFGFTKYYGDAAYDWVKLYYSIVGNYDQFNRKRFSLKIDSQEILLNIESNNWEEMEQVFFELLEGEVNRTQTKLLHAITWLSLTTYAWEDYDSICGAFYKGLLLLNELF